MVNLNNFFTKFQWIFGKYMWEKLLPLGYLWNLEVKSPRPSSQFVYWVDCGWTEFRTLCIISFIMRKKKFTHVKQHTHDKIQQHSVRDDVITLGRTLGYAVVERDQKNVVEFIVVNQKLGGE